MRTCSRKRDHRRRLGDAGENAVCELLKCRGMEILARNWKCKAGELDIVAFDDGEVVFTEVKTMRKKAGFIPASNLSSRQRRRNFNAAKVYMRTFGILKKTARFDLAEVVFQGAFLTSIVRHKNYLPQLPAMEDEE